MAITRKERKENWCYAVAETARKLEAANPMAVGAIVMPDRVIWVDSRKLNKPLIGVAKCSSEDEFDLDTGIAIAYARAYSEHIPDFVLDSDERVEVRSLPIDSTFELDGECYVKVMGDYHVARCYNFATRKSVSLSGKTLVKECKLR